MLTSGRTGLRAGRRGSCRRTQGDSRRIRHLSVEQLEQRWLLSADFLGWQNVLTPTDVNADGTVSAIDALLVVHELYTGGARQLAPPSVSSAATLAGDGAAEGESSGHAFFDVNGDNSLSAVDALLVIADLRAEGQTDLVSFQLVTTDLSGTPITTVEQGSSFLLNVYVQDLRDESVNDRGVYQAFLDVTFDDTLVTAVGPVTHGDDYLESAAGSLATPGLVDELGGAQTGFAIDPFGPLGPGNLLLASVTFEATSPGTVVFASDPADLTGLDHDVVFYNPPETVPSDDVIFGSANLTIVAGPLVAHHDAFDVNEDTSANPLDVLANDEVNSGGTLSIVGVGSTNHGGTVVNQGNQLLYTPAANFIGQETFTYTISDGLGHTDEGTVVVTVANSNNDAPVANDDGGAGYTTRSDKTLTTGNVLSNDTDPDGDTLTILTNTTATKGLVTNNGDGTFQYNPNGQFGYLAYGQQATDTFTYTVTDGHGLTDTATVTITITGAPPVAGDVTGSVFADVDNDGVRDATERAISNVEVRLQGVDFSGAAVSLTTRTDAQGQYRFANVSPGNYQLTEVQPTFFVDGIDTVGGVVQTNPNDRVTITSNMSLSGLAVSFGERSLEPAFLGLANGLNSSLRVGVVVGLDNDGNMLWYSLMDGWDDVTSISVAFSEDGQTATLTATSDLDDGDLECAVPTAPTQMQYRVLGKTSEGSVVQFFGTADEFRQRAADQAAQEEEPGSGENPFDNWFSLLGR